MTVRRGSIGLVSHWVAFPLPRSTLFLRKVKVNRFRWSELCERSQDLGVRRRTRLLYEIRNKSDGPSSRIRAC
jgi:hypothetical protein